MNEEEEYINNYNDPSKVVKIENEEEIILDDEVIEDDEVIGCGVDILVRKKTK